MESIVDSDEEEDLAESIDVSVAVVQFLLLRHNSPDNEHELSKLLVCYMFICFR